MMARLWIISLMFISCCAISQASWDGPVQTIEKEETIPIPHNAHPHDQTSAVISTQDDEVKENRVEPVLIVNTTSPSASSAGAFSILGAVFIATIWRLF